MITARIPAFSIAAIAYSFRPSAGSIGVLLRYQLVGLFLPETPAAVAFGADRAKAVATFAFIYSVMGTLNAALRGYGVSIAPAVINIFALFGFRLIWAYTYFPKHPTLFHLYISYPISWTITTTVHIICFIIVFNKLRKRIA